MADDASVPPSGATPPTLQSRLVCSIPLLLFFIVFFAILHANTRFEVTFIEMDLSGGLPLLTLVVILVVHTVQQFWYVIMPAMFVLAWLYFAWGCKTQARMFWCSVGTAIVTVLMFISGFYGVYLAMIYLRK